MNRALLGFVVFCFAAAVSGAAHADFKIISPFETAFLTEEEWAELETTDLAIEDWKSYRERLADDVREARERVLEVQKFSDYKEAEKAAAKMAAKGIKDIATKSWKTSGRIKGGINAAKRYAKFIKTEDKILQNIDGVNLQKAQDELDKAKANYNLATSYIDGLKNERQRIINKSDENWEQMKTNFSEALADHLKERRRIEDSKEVQIRQQAPRLQQGIQRQQQLERARQKQRRIMQFRQDVQNWVKSGGGQPGFKAPGGSSGGSSDGFSYPDASITFTPEDFPDLEPDTIREKIDE